MSPASTASRSSRLNSTSRCYVPRLRARAALDGAEAIHQLLAAAAPATAPEGPGLTEERADPGT